MPRSPRFAYVCPNCACWHWSAQYRKSLTRTCLACWHHGRQYRRDTPEARRDTARVDSALEGADYPQGVD
jgi:hypothetical protein